MQVTGLAPVQTPFWQVSVCVHRLLSTHAVPSFFVGSEQVPVAASHAPAAWHWSLAVQVTGLAPKHRPPWQVSVCVHALPSEQVEPFFFAGSLHRPVEVSHVPAVWHWSLAAHSTALLPVHAPP